MATPQPAKKTIAFVAYEGLTILDLVGPLQALSGLQSLNELGLVRSPYVTTVVGERIEPLDTDTPLKVLPERTLEEVPHPAVVVVPGGGLPTLRAMANEAIRQYLRTAAATAEVVGSVCTGALILAAAGLLQGRRATTHWGYYGFLNSLGAHYVPERWVEDGKFITSAGVSAGIDMALRLAARLAEEPAARLVQLGMEYDPHPPFGGIDWSRVNRDMYVPVVAPHLRELKQVYAARPDLAAAAEAWLGAAAVQG